MPRFIAFLRAVNVGGRTVSMASLRSHFEFLGFTNVETFIASGNVIFETTATGEVALQRRIEAHLAGSLGWEVHTFLRTDTELAAVAAARPFSAKALAAATAFNVAFLAEPLPPGSERAVGKFRTESDDFRLVGRELYWLCKTRQSESTFSNAAFERALGVRATFRGMNTVRKLTAKYPASAPAK